MGMRFRKIWVVDGVLCGDVVVTARSWIGV